jgi:hypothetical protein
MNSFERTLIHKAGYDHGWEVVVEDNAEQVVLASALHGARACIISPLPVAPWTMVNFQPRQIHRELERALPGYYLTDESFGAENESQLGVLFSHAARLARNLPDEPCRRYVKAVAEELATSSLTSATEIERLVRQRIGQDIYRDSLMDYWGGACAVTGIAVPELLRASHAKAWSECDSDADRLNVYNGFLLTAHLDALFDRHLMTFNDDGGAIFAPEIDDALKAKLGLAGPVKLRWISSEHLPFLKWHRSKFQG